MQEWIFNILKNGTLVDNQLYQTKGGILYNNRLQEPVKLKKRESGQWKYDYNDENKIWKFLNNVDRDVKELLEKRDRPIVLFGNREYEHNSEENFLEVSGLDCLNFTLKTSNIIGYIKRGSYSIKISSRFGDKFLKHIISDAEGFLEIDDYGGATEAEGYEWLLIYLWKTKVKKAYRLGLPKSYVTKNERLSKVRGGIDVLDYFINKDMGRYHCQYREHSYNNDANLLIASAFEKIGPHEFLYDCTSIRSAFYTAVEGKKASRKELYTTKHFSNPFYNDYNEVINLSKLVLRDDLADFGEQSENKAFFFDVSMLFEYFVRKLLKRVGVVFENKFAERLSIPTGIKSYRRKLEPDLVFNVNGKICLFDVKYKSFDFLYGPKREDLFQLHTYVGQYGNLGSVNACGFIYPVLASRWKNLGFKEDSCFIKDSLSIMANEVQFYIFFIKVPDNQSETFHLDFSNSTNQFLHSFHGNLL